MSFLDLLYDRRSRRLGPLVRGHLLLFDPPPRPSYPPAAGVRLLLAFLALEFLIGPRAHLLGWLGLAPLPPWPRVAALLAALLMASRAWARVRFRDLGFLPAREWGATQTLYLVQVVALANLVFASLYARPLATLQGEPALWLPAASILALQFCWGFYQEALYRGVLQTELTRRLGSIAGPLLANLLFTFGPLHFYHWGARGWPGALPMLAAIFAIGLFFAVLFHRTRNVWMVGVFHGLGNAYLNGAPEIGGLAG